MTSLLFLISILFTACALLLVMPCHPGFENPFLLLLLSSSMPAHAEESRGAYLAKLGDCTSCHTALGMPEFAGGYPVYSPFGAIYGTNITPDRDYGIGTYRLEDFARALRDGIAKDGRHLYPAMPYPSFTGMSDVDVKDLRLFHA